MSVFQELNTSNSTIVTWGGIELRTIQDPFVSDDGEHYKGQAVDSENKEYMIFWEIINHETTDESEICDWENPVQVIQL